MSTAPALARDPRAQVHPTYARIHVEPVTPTIGAEITGVDLSRGLDPETAADIQKALHDWRMVFIRDQDLTNEELKAVGRAFGPLTPARPIAEGLPDHPEIWERSVDDYRKRRVANDTASPGRQPPRDFKGWHIDITFVANPNRYSILYGIDIPRFGGDILFANLIAAYDGLSPPVRALIDGLQAVHKTSDYDFGQGPRRKGAGGAYVSLHPLVRVHPETGEKLLFLNPGVVSHITGLKERESQALIDLLYGEVTRPEYQARLRWRPKSLVIWDNQAVAHAGPIDYAHFDLPRTVRRITVAGELPKGPDGFVSRPLEGELFDVIG